MITEYKKARGEFSSPTPSPNPPCSPNEPSDRDYDEGFMIRVFAVKNTNGTIIETNDDFSANDLYEVFTVNWQITGPERDIYNQVGVPIRNGAFDTNQRQVERYNRKYPGFSRKIDGDFLKHWDDTR